MGRIMVPDTPRSEHETLVEDSRDEFCRRFEASRLVLLHEKDSRFSTILGRDRTGRR